jgi:hypothetical protein
VEITKPPLAELVKWLQRQLLDHATTVALLNSVQVSLLLTVAVKRGLVPMASTLIPLAKRKSLSLNNIFYSECTLCPAGYYCLNGSKTACSGGGKYCFAGQSATITCPAGFYCADSSTGDSPVPCGWGQWSNSGATSCSTYNDNEKGDVIESNSYSTCPAGWYIEAGEHRCNECTAG